MAGASVTGTTVGSSRPGSRYAGSADTKRAPDGRSAASGHLSLSPWTRRPPASAVRVRRAHDRTQKWYLDALTLRGVTFPIYAAETWRAQIGNGWGTLAKPVGAPSNSSGDGVSDLTVDHLSSLDRDRFTDHPQMKVTTSVDDAQYGDTQLESARWVLAHWQHESQTAWPRVSTPR